MKYKRVVLLLSTKMTESRVNGRHVIGTEQSLLLQNDIMEELRFFVCFLFL